MTKQMVEEATKYVERSIESQTKLGYKAPAQAVVRAAIKETAQALESLQGLKGERLTKR
jgi:hypothetical protein